jgi:hypothetical protein
MTIQLFATAPPALVAMEAAPLRLRRLGLDASE